MRSILTLCLCLIGLSACEGTELDNILLEQAATELGTNGDALTQGLAEQAKKIAEDPDAALSNLSEKAGNLTDTCKQATAAVEAYSQLLEGTEIITGSMNMKAAALEAEMRSACMTAQEVQNTTNQVIEINEQLAGENTELGTADATPEAPTEPAKTEAPEAPAP